MTPVRWVVLWKRDNDPTEVYSFELEADARAFFERASVQWSEVYLLRVVDGPRDVVAPLDEAAIYDDGYASGYADAFADAGLRVGRLSRLRVALRRWWRS